MRFFDAFAGVGGFHVGIQNAYSRVEDEREKALGLRTTELQSEGSDNTGTRLPLRERPNRDTRDSARPECVGYSEIDKYAIKVYEKQFPGVPNYGDITKINAEELPDFDCLVGGFPCQAFSIAGKRRGFDDTRGTLFFDLARILREKQPRLFVFENVKGLLSHDKGRTFATIIATIDELGYDCQWQVLNSKNHGVPQNRERIYIVGHLRGTPRPQVFPIATDDREASELPGQYTNTLTARYEGAQAVGSYVAESKLDAQEIRQLNQPTHSNDRVYASDGISPTLNTMQGGNRQPFIQAVDTKNVGDPRFTANVATLGANDYKEPKAVTDGIKIRRLTPIECERLQGFPDRWTAEGIDGPISDTQRYKMCGNAVTTNVVQAVFERIFETTMEAEL